jgi:formylglycine-generating enzyme required for sulfatase activity
MLLKDKVVILVSVFIFAVSVNVSWAEDVKSMTNSIGMEFVLIPEGSFMMGSDADPKNVNIKEDESPKHKVTITKPFYIGKYEVTQAQWVRLMGDNPSAFKMKEEPRPVENVSWDDVQTFIQNLNKKERTKRYRLPTEAEWEYAARAGADTAYYFGDNPDLLPEYGWYEKNSDGETHPVGLLKPNAWGLYDIHGNVWEWCQDWYGGKYYAVSPLSDPEGHPFGDFRVFRGGSWYSFDRQCRSTNRPTNYFKYERKDFFGFRVVKEF